MFKITRSGNPIGDQLLASLFVHVLNDNNIESVFGELLYDYIIDCPVNEETRDYILYDFKYEHGKKSIIESGIEKFKKEFSITQDIKINRSYIPVKFKYVENIPAYNVVIISKSGFWSPVRDWPYFSQLKEKLDKLNVTWIDLTERRIRNNDFLNYVSKSKVFVTLETGASHLASMVAKSEQTLVIQSGYSNSSFWNIYNYDFISYDTDCKSCFKRSCEKHDCMKNISVDNVLQKIQTKL